MTESGIHAIWLSLQLALLSTAILIVLCTPLAWWLANTRSKAKPFVEAVCALPLVLPPTVIGFYLLLSYSWLNSQTGIALAFSFAGLVFGSLLYSLPFVVQPLQQAFSSLGNRPLEVAATLGASPFDCFKSVVLPACKTGYFAAAALGFAHTLGEFGVVLMIGGNIPGQTQTASIAIYEHVELLEFGKAHVLSLVMLGLSFLILSSVYLINRQALFSAKPADKELSANGEPSAYKEPSA